ncbi:LYR motif-containing protein 9 isoform X3 [Phytophthora cinnamomi]|uniref:LYR motif-containing protein 9 isoform X3 n=1 Tax=Phytophthora cinnamomi TaxID=4785 RepID=UPI00355A361C|nr:LYR motif-containing protein 9 isoform X3 [Phytophthora cinnamomi]
MPLTLAQAQCHSRSLYRRILRESRQLEPNTREFYRRFARSVQGFPSHAGDTDPDAIEDHIRRVEQDIHCVLLDHGLHSS